jgi:hypothetical protein
MNFILNIFKIFVSTDPNRSGSDIRKVLVIDFVFFVWSQDVEVITSFLCRFFVVHDIVYNFSEIDNGSFLNLNFALGVELDSGVMNETHISKVELSAN